jgi:hypothetical protein
MSKAPAQLKDQNGRVTDERVDGDDGNLSGKLTFVCYYKKKHVIYKHPYDNSALGYMRDPTMYRHLDDKRLYIRFYKCFSNGEKKKSVGQLFFLCRNIVDNNPDVLCTYQKRSDYAFLRKDHPDEHNPAAFAVKEKKEDVIEKREYDKHSMTLDSNPILDSVCRLFMDCAYAFRSVESKYFKDMLMNTLSLCGDILFFLVFCIFVFSF